MAVENHVRQITKMHLSIWRGRTIPRLFRVIHKLHRPKIVLDKKKNYAKFFSCRIFKFLIEVASPLLDTTNKFGRLKSVLYPKSICRFIRPVDVHLKNVFKCWKVERIFCLFQCSRNIGWSPWNKYYIIYEGPLVITNPLIDSYFCYVMLLCKCAQCTIIINQAYNARCCLVRPLKLNNLLTL